MEESNQKLKKPKLLLILIKYIFHLLALGYILYTILQFIGIDSILIGSFVHVAILPWIVLVSISVLLRFCYVHRLPLYYILLNEGITNIDYYIGMPISVINLLILHILLIAFLIFGYSFYYVKYKLWYS